MARADLQLIYTIINVYFWTAQSFEQTDSNFFQLLLLRGIDDVTICGLLAKKQDKYTSPQIQNELLQIMALSIIQDIASSIRDAKYFTIMGDEMTDASNREQVVVCFHWVGSDFEPHEDFVGLHKVDKVNADAVKDVVLRMN